MAEKKNTVVASETEAQELEAFSTEQQGGVFGVAVEEEVDVSLSKKIPLIRTEFGKAPNGDARYSYRVNGTFKGKDTRINLKPLDEKGYLVLDLIFENVSSDVTVSVVEKTMIDNSGKKSRYTEYKAVAVDAQGEVYDYKIKPASPSDKWLLDNYVRELSASKNA